MRRVESLATALGRRADGPEHLATGELGEREALFHLRRIGYTVVAPKVEEFEVAGVILTWSAGTGRRCVFVEVKTRSGRGCDDGGVGCGSRQA